jgi:ribosomal protein L7Ae-like RNA K-turn-binding protein
MVCEALRAGGKTPVLAVLEAEDTSAATHEKLVSKCTYYRTPHYRIPVNTSRLAHAVGKTGAVAAVGVTDENLLRALSRYLPESTPSQGEPPQSGAQE